ncbi:PTS sugar transporter subunit IIA [Pontixanthobacter sp.]|uniref:PTS sugar transporter subunit IIA n=1 Tax=Pontixanthobacter sp. TaxID=2792078 RepID=UPI003C7EA95B
MLDANFILGPEAVGVSYAADKTAVLCTLAERFAHIYAVDRSAVLESLEEREALGSTGFGRGVAIPHARIEGISRPVSIVIRLERSIAFDSADGMPVDLVFGLLSPAGSGAAHLHALAAISRLIRDETIRDALGNAADGEELYAMLSNVWDRDAA